ncbi:MAG: ribosome biosis GTPase Der [Bacteriovoracaceae bacterium]|nr:ribosome biosis GTPase Der [Bacteriovoracaceae bacterium]
MIIALAGRPNVGKSSLFNRLVGHRKSLVWDQPGVTRDLVKGTWRPMDRENVEVWDLAGFGKIGLSFQTLDADHLSQIDLILLVIDGSEPLTSDDRECFETIRKLSKPIVVAVNKSDKKSYRDYSEEVSEFFSNYPIIPISAEEKRGLGDLEEKLVELIQTNAIPQNIEQKSSRRVLILGRPNVGKSSFLNCIAGNAISFVSDQPGTTRDVIEHRVSRKTGDWIFSDTAGVRKKSKVYGRKGDPVEIFSVEKSIKELKQSDFAVFIVEAQRDGKLNSQDRKLLHLIRSSLVPTLILVNKWDLVRNDWIEKDYRQMLKDQLGDLHFLPILFISAKTGFRVEKVFQILGDVERAVHEISTSKLNRWLQKTVATRPPRVAKRGRNDRSGRSATQYLQIRYMVQTSKRPMTFQFFCNAPQAVAEEDRRFLANQLRKEFHLSGVPFKFVFRRKAS